MFQQMQLENIAVPSYTVSFFISFAGHVQDASLYAPVKLHCLCDYSRLSVS